MTVKANQVDTKLDDVLAKVDKAADEAIKSLESGSSELVESLGEAGNFGKNLSAIGRKLRDRLGVNTNNPPAEDKKSWLG